MKQEVIPVVEVFRLDSGGGYEWAEFRVYRHPRVPNLYAVSGQSGCSCDGFTEPTTLELAAYQPLYFAEVRRAMQEFIHTHEYHFSAYFALEAMERLRAQMRDNWGIREGWELADV